MLTGVPPLLMDLDVLAQPLVTVCGALPAGVRSSNSQSPAADAVRHGGGAPPAGEREVGAAEAVDVSTEAVSVISFGWLC